MEKKETDAKEKKDGHRDIVGEGCLFSYLLWQAVGFIFLIKWIFTEMSYWETLKLAYKWGLIILPVGFLIYLLGIGIAEEIKKNKNGKRRTEKRK